MRAHVDCRHKPEGGGSGRERYGLTHALQPDSDPDIGTLQIARRHACAAGLFKCVAGLQHGTILPGTGDEGQADRQFLYLSHRNGQARIARDRWENAAPTPAKLSRWMGSRPARWDRKCGPGQKSKYPPAKPGALVL